MPQPSIHHSQSRLITCLKMLSCSALLCALPALATDMDVDEADSLNFESFHTDKKAAIQLWKREPKNETVRQYPAGPQSVENGAKGLVVEERLDGAVAQGRSSQQPSGQPGQRYEIRERYALGRSSHTPYSAFYVIEALHGQMARLCPQGWQKLAEWSEPVGDDFYLYYELECR